MRQQPPGGRGSGVPMTNTCALQRPRTSEDSFLPHTWAESLYKTRRSSGGRAAGSQRGDPCQLSGSSLARGKAAGSHQPEQECQATVWVQRAWVHLPRHPCWATGFFLLGPVSEHSPFVNRGFGFSSGPGGPRAMQRGEEGWMCISGREGKELRSQGQTPRNILPGRVLETPSLRHRPGRFLRRAGDPKQPPRN